MRKALLIALGLFLAATSGAAAQTPIVSVYFDDLLTDGSKDCPTGGGVDSFYVVLENFNTWVSGIEYLIDYPGTMTWLSDFGTPPVTLGTTPVGISSGFGMPRNGYSKIVAAQVLFLWNCNGCETSDDPIVVRGHPEFAPAPPRGTDWPNYDFIEAVGMTSLVCATVPVEETTWGHIKSLFDE